MRKRFRSGDARIGLATNSNDGEKNGGVGSARLDGVRIDGEFGENPNDDSTNFRAAETSGTAARSEFFRRRAPFLTARTVKR